MDRFRFKLGSVAISSAQSLGVLRLMDRFRFLLGSVAKALSNK